MIKSKDVQLKIRVPSFSVLLHLQVSNGALKKNSPKNLVAFLRKPLGVPGFSVENP